MNPMLDWLLLRPIWMAISGKHRLVLRLINEDQRIDKRKVIYLDPSIKDDKDLIDTLNNHRGSKS
jgi:hypothetical protein